MHVIAVFQVLIYVGAVMVFMVYAIMLLDVRDRSFTRRFSRLLVPGIAGACCSSACSCIGLWHGPPAGRRARLRGALFGLQPFLRRLPERVLAALRARLRYCWSPPSWRRSP